MSTDQSISKDILAAEDYVQQRRYNEAITLCKRILSDSADDLRALSLLGLAHLELGNKQHAIEIFKGSLRKDPKQIDVLTNLGLALDNLGQYTQAVACYREALQYQSDFEPALINLSAALLQLGDLSGAMRVTKEALIEIPENMALLNNLIVIYLDAEMYEQASQTIQHALSIDSQYPDIYINLARLNSFCGNHRASIQQLRYADYLRPNHPDTLYNLSLSLLFSHEYDEGWKLYKWRFERDPNKGYLSAPWDPSFKLPHTNLQGKSHPSEIKLLTVHEQGIGDELFFLRFANLAEKEGYHVSYLPSKKLYTLLENERLIQSNITFLDPAKAVEPDNYDLIMGIGDLPSILKQYPPQQIPPFKLRANSQIVENILDKGKTLPKPWIGITLAAGKKLHSRGSDKQVSIISILEAIDEQEGTLFVLQQSVEPELIKELSNVTDFEVIDGSWWTQNLPELTAVLYSLDSYVGVSSTNMHILSGLNKSATIIETATLDFKWSHDAEGHPVWFPNFKRIPFSISLPISTPLPIENRNQ